MIDLYIFNESARAAVYGIGTYIKELTYALKEAKNFSTCIIHLNSDKTDFEQEYTDGIRHWYFPASTQKKHYKNPDSKASYYRNVIYILQLQIKGKNRTIFHLNYTQSTKLAERLKEVFDCRIVVTVHYSGWGFSLLGNMERLDHILAKEQPDDFEKNIIESVVSEKSFYQHADQTISLAEYMKNILVKHYHLDAVKVKIIPNGLTDNKNASDRRLLRKKWMIDSKTKVIIFAGRMDEVKGLKFLIQSFKILLLQNPNCHLIICGNGDYESYMKEAKDICTKITFTGFLEKQELYELYQIADIGVVPSLYEPFGYVAVEMMMHSLPVVATATSGLNEVVDNTCGLKVPIIEHPDKVEIDAGLLSERILYLLQHPKEAQQMGKNARKRYLENYTSEIFRRNMINFYQSLFL